MKKPTFASVTEEPCKCGYLDRAAKNTDNPIKFNPTTGEFSFQYKSKRGVSSLMIYHCPFCGGAAPPRLKDDSFETVSDSESARLFELIEKIKTLEDTYAQLGEPDDIEEGHGMGTHNSEEQPQTLQRGRGLVYKKLSKVADVIIEDYRKDRVSITLRSKRKMPANKAHVPPANQRSAQ